MRVVLGIKNRNRLEVIIHVRLRRPFSLRFPDFVGVDIIRISSGSGLAGIPVRVFTSNFFSVCEMW